MRIELNEEQMEKITIENLLRDYGYAVHEQNTEISDLLLRVLELYSVSEIEAKARFGIK